MVGGSHGGGEQLMLIVSDVHGEFDALHRVASTGEILLVLGDLINLTDYRSGEGITADLLGREFAQAASGARAAGDYEEMRRLFRVHVGDRGDEFRQAYLDKIIEQYQQTTAALAPTTSYVTFGNVDRPALLRQHLPPSATFVDGDVVEIEGVVIGFVGGGISTPLHAEGEVSDEEMEAKLDGLGPVEVLCSHLPPDVGPLHTDVVTGRPERASAPIRRYLERHRPRFHFFGDVHQPQAHAWRFGLTSCRNVGYFRATKRPVRFVPNR